MVEDSNCYFSCGDDMGNTGLKLGDLIALKKHCKCSGRLGIIVSMPSWAKNYCYIAFMDDPTRTIQASLKNIIKIN